MLSADRVPLNMYMAWDVTPTAAANTSGSVAGVENGSEDSEGMCDGWQRLYAARATNAPTNRLSHIEGVLMELLLELRSATAFLRRAQCREGKLDDARDPCRE